MSDAVISISQAWLDENRSDTSLDVLVCINPLELAKESDESKPLINQNIMNY